MREKLIKALEILKEKTKKECYKMVVEEGKPEITDNKLGGIPYMPLGEDYPLDSEGDPMGLLIQVNLKDIDLEDYPKTGILQVFTDAKGLWPCQYKIKYVKEGLEYRTDLDEIDTDEFYIIRPMKIRFEKSVAYMSVNDYRFFDILCPILNEILGTNLEHYGQTSDYFDENGLEEWFSIVLDSIPYDFGTIGGYPDFTQDDPRPLGRDLEECLFKLDSCLKGENIILGDSGIMFCFISKEDIKSCKFENAFLDWDCC